MRFRFMMPVLLLGVLTLGSGCAGVTLPDNGGVTRPPSATHSESTGLGKDQLTLSCGGSQPVSDYGTPVLGLSSDAWGNGGMARDIDLGALSNYSAMGYTFVKSPLVVLPVAAQNTRIEVASPKSVKLYYTSWSLWGSLDTREMLSSASTAIVAPRCDEAVQFPGGVFVKEPGCVTLELVPVAQPQQRRSVQLPVGARCGV